MRYRSIASILPMLKLQSGIPHIDQFKPELAQMVPMVERNLGLSEAALIKKQSGDLEVSRSVVDLPVDLFEPIEISDFCIPPIILNGIKYCTCNQQSCCCGFRFLMDGSGDFSFGDTLLRCPFTSGTINFWYWALQMDEEGLPMILEGHVEAFNAFAIQLLKQGEMNAGKISPQLFKINKDLWNEQSLITRSRDNVPSKKSILIADYITTHPYKYKLR